jgi:hypothetical protein
LVLIVISCCNKWQQSSGPSPITDEIPFSFIYVCIISFLHPWIESSVHDYFHLLYEFVVVLDIFLSLSISSIQFN